MTTPQTEPRYPCSKRALADQRAAELAWARLRRLDPAGADRLVVYWCARCLAFHVGHRPKAGQ
jgi:hypothetical protein